MAPKVHAVDATEAANGLVLAERTLENKAWTLVSKLVGQQFWHSGRAHALGADTREDVGSIPARCWGSFLPHFIINWLRALNKIHLRRCICTIDEVKKNIFLVILLGAKQT